MYSHWLGYSFAYGTQEYPNYWLFLTHFILIYVIQYFIFIKYDQPNLVKNFGLGTLSYFGFFFAHSVFYYVLRFFLNQKNHLKKRAFSSGVGIIQASFLPKKRYLFLAITS